MTPSQALNAHRADVRRLVLDHRAANPRIFGSVLRGEDTANSDLDLLVDPTPDTTLLDLAALQIALEKLLGVTVDVLTPRSLPEAFRQSILVQAQSV